METGSDAHFTHAAFRDNLVAEPEHQNSVQFPSLNDPVKPRVTFTHQRTTSNTRVRSKSLSEKSQEMALHLAPPISVPLVVLCLLWYTTSAVSSTLSKSILNRAACPVGLTLIQFMYAAFFGSVFCKLAAVYPAMIPFFPENTVTDRGLSRPNANITHSTAPMALFQLMGHLFSYTSMSQIPVSMLHAIKSLSPLFTVVAYTVVLRVYYNWSTYASLVPLTLGVVMTCSSEFRARPMPIFYALTSTIIFVSQNMYSKRLLTTGSRTAGAHRVSGSSLDKMTILTWCNIFAFLGTFPIWLLSESRQLSAGSVTIHGPLLELWILTTLNGFSHFVQNLLAFLVLGSTSTVTYSVASLLKRIVIISVAIIWFGQRVTLQQGWGILITFTGLYIYDRFGSKQESAKVLPR